MRKNKEIKSNEKIIPEIKVENCPLGKLFCDDCGWYNHNHKCCAYNTPNGKRLRKLFGG